MRYCTWKILCMQFTRRNLGTISLRLWCASGSSIRAAAGVKGKAGSMEQGCDSLYTVWWLNRSFTHQIKENCPTHNVIEPNSSKVASDTFCLKNRICPWRQSHVAPCSWMAVIMWGDWEKKTLTHHVFVSFCYCVIVVTVSGNLYWKITVMVSPPDQDFNNIPPWKWESERVSCLLIVIK